MSYYDYVGLSRMDVFCLYDKKMRIIEEKLISHAEDDTYKKLIDEYISIRSDLSQFCIHNGKILSNISEYDYFTVIKELLYRSNNLLDDIVEKETYRGPELSCDGPGRHA